MIESWYLKIASNKDINALKTFPFVKINVRENEKKSHEKKSQKFLLTDINGLKLFSGVLN